MPWRQGASLLVIFMGIQAHKIEYMDMGNVRLHCIGYRDHITIYYEKETTGKVTFDFLSLKKEIG